MFNLVLGAISVGVVMNVLACIIVAGQSIMGIDPNEIFKGIYGFTMLIAAMGIILVSREFFNVISWQMWTAVVAGAIGTLGLVTLKNRNYLRGGVLTLGTIGIAVAGIGTLYSLPLTTSLN